MPVSRADNAMMAKARGLYGKRLKAQDYEMLLQKRGLPEIVGYLKNETYYGEALREVKEELIHREQLESLIDRRRFEIIASLARFSQNDKLFFTMYVMKSEIGQLLFAMRLLNAGEMQKFIVALPVHIAKYLSVDLFRLAAAKDYDGLLETCERTRYYPILRRFRPTLSDQPIDIPGCEAALLTQYWQALLGSARESYSGRTLEALEKLLYYQIDTHNVYVTYRMKRFFKADASKYIVNIPTKMSRATLAALLAAESAESLTEILGRHNLAARLKLNRRMFTFSFEPAVSAISYVSLLDIEAANIIRIVEGARYGLSPAETRALLII
jgi:V/A-type H+-transporting ATPase subunit C